ncbi:MAG: ATP-binding protein [Firmicutes bacterium]|nr:ATP-binding protein [Bacillota bacterium]
MNIKRKIYDKLLAWKKEANGSKALLIEGARRVGKTTVLTEFAEKEYRSYIIIDFAKASKAVKDNFDNLENLDVFFQNLMLEYNTRLYQRESLIVFDEVQKYPAAREAIKYLVQDGRYDYLESGSLISIKENVSDIVIPSEERTIKMYPLDFEEFATALQEEILLEYIEKCFREKQPLEQRMHTKAMRLFQEYLLVGGMPQSVVAYIENNRDFIASDIEKRDILAMYRGDIRKASRKYNMRVSGIFENIPAYLSTHEKKVVLKKAEEGATFSMFEDPLFWLGDSMICNLCYKCTDPNIGFELNKDDSAVKCYMGDTGLLFSLAFGENEIASENLYHSIMTGKLALNKGMIYENMIAQMISAQGKKLFFYTRYNEEKHRNDIEIDFMLSNESRTSMKIYPIEVKSAKNYSTTSLDEFRQIYSKRISQSYIVHPKNYSNDGNLIKIPPYMLPLVLQ